MFFCIRNAALLFIKKIKKIKAMGQLMASKKVAIEV